MNGNCTGVAALFYKCYWKSKECDLWEAQNQNSIDYYEWLGCYSDRGDACSGDEGGIFLGCYVNNTCVGIVAPGWYDCYWKSEGDTCRRELSRELAKKKKDSKKIEITEEKVTGPVRFVSMKVFNGRYEGIRLYDENNKYISDLIWS